MSKLKAVKIGVVIPNKTMILYLCEHQRRLKKSPIVDLSFNLCVSCLCLGSLIKGAVSRYSVIFAGFFLRARENGDCSRKCRRHQAMTARSAANSFAAQAESSKCCFLRSCLVAAIIFPHTKWLTKITDYRETAALKQYSLSQSLTLTE